MNLVAIGGIEPPLNAYETLVLPLNYMAIIILVATERIELSSSDYRSLAFPLSYAAIFWLAHCESNAGSLIKSQLLCH